MADRIANHAVNPRAPADSVRAIQRLHFFERDLAGRRRVFHRRIGKRACLRAAQGSASAARRRPSARQSHRAVPRASRKHSPRLRKRIALGRDFDRIRRSRDEVSCDALPDSAAQRLEKNAPTQSAALRPSSTSSKLRRAPRRRLNLEVVPLAARAQRVRQMNELLRDRARDSAPPPLAAGTSRSTSSRARAFAEAASASRKKPLDLAGRRQASPGAIPPCGWLQAPARAAATLRRRVCRRHHRANFRLADHLDTCPPDLP